MTQYLKIHDTNGMKLLNRLRLYFSHLNEHKLRNNFRTIINPIAAVVLNQKH